MDVLIEISGAPDHDHPDRQHETDAKGCEHFQFPPCRNLLPKLLLFYDKSGRRAIPIEAI
jgi:hypothetical protein